jgi:hypothetical protein
MLVRSATVPGYLSVQFARDSEPLSLSEQGVRVVMHWWHWLIFLALALGLDWFDYRGWPF